MKPRTLVLCLCLFILAVGAPGLPGASAAPSSAGGDSGAPIDYASLQEKSGLIIIVKTSGGGQFQGRLFAVLEDRIELLDGEGQILDLARSAIISVMEVDNGKDPAEYFQDSAQNRLVIMPTGFGMEKGEFHVAAQEIIVITSSYGISPNFSLWGGVSIPGGVVNLRYSGRLGPRAALSLGAFLGTLWSELDATILPYGILSFGHPNRNLTLGAGIPFLVSTDKALRPVGLVGAVGGKIIVSGSASIVTENWIVAISDGWIWDTLDISVFPAVAFRIAGSRLSWDIGAVLPFQIRRIDGLIETDGLFGGTLIPIPLLSVTYRID